MPFVGRKEWTLYEDIIIYRVCQKIAIVIKVPFCKIMNNFWNLTSWYEYYIKIKSIAVLSTFLHHFYHGIQYDKICNFVHGKTFEVQHEI